MNSILWCNLPLVSLWLGAIYAVGWMPIVRWPAVDAYFSAEACLFFALDLPVMAWSADGLERAIEERCLLGLGIRVMADSSSSDVALGFTSGTYRMLG
jgi:hypothetical protein